MNCSIHTNIHPMIGLDLHMGSPAPAITPVPMPHITAQVLGGLNTSAKLVPKVLSHNFITLNQGTDIGIGIGHVPLAPNWLFGLYILTSGSVSHFGSFSVLSGGAPTAAAILPIPFVGIGINMNCSSPLNLPVGRVIAPGCNTVGVGPSDVLASSISMAIDAAVSFAAGKIGSGLIKGAHRAVPAVARKAASARLIGPLITNINRSTDKVAQKVAQKVSKEAVEEIIGGAIGKLSAGITGVASDNAAEFYREAFIDNYSNGSLINP